jgi:hypothetical protein
VDFSRSAPACAVGAHASSCGAAPRARPHLAIWRTIRYETDLNATARTTAVKPCVFIHTNHKQYLGALVSQYSFKRNSPNGAKFDVNIIHSNDHPFLRAKEGQSFLRAGGMRPWHMEDLQSFTPLRFLAPELMGYEGRAVVVDPDVFAVGDVYELLTRDMAGKAIMCRTRTGSKGASGGLATSVMLLDCAKLTHWRCEEQFNELFAGKRDYMDWIQLHGEPKDSIGIFEDEWNDFDRLNENTKLLHNTKRQTQPWKSGLPIDFTWADKKVEPLKPATWPRLIKRWKTASEKTYKAHPDSNQERFFFGLLRECLDKGVVTEALLREEMRHNHVRHDALEMVERTPPLAA